MAIPVLQLGPGGDYVTQYHAQQDRLIAVQSNVSSQEDRNSGQFAKRKKQPKAKQHPRAISVHPAPAPGSPKSIIRGSDSYQPSDPLIANTYQRPTHQLAPQQPVGAETVDLQTALNTMMNLPSQQQEQALRLFSTVLSKIQSVSAKPLTHHSTTLEKSERQRAIAHVLEDLRQLRCDLNVADRSVHTSLPEVAYESSSLTESDSQATGYRPSHSSEPTHKGLFADDAGARRRFERQQGYRLRARRSAHQKRRAYQTTQQGSLFGG